MASTDALGNTTSYTYDASGNQTLVVDPLNRTNAFSYDANGRLLTHSDPVGNVTVNTYDQAGNLLGTVQKDSRGNTVGGSSSVYNGSQLTETRDFNGVTVARFAYDGSGNLTSTTNVTGFARNFQYDGNGSQTVSYHTGTNLAGAPVPVGMTNIFDAQGRVTQAIDAYGRTNFTFYNAMGKTDYTVDIFGNTNRFTYDARGNLIETVSPFGASRTVFDDNARPILTSDRNGISGMRTDYDAVGRVTNSVRLTNVVINIVADASNTGQKTSTIGSAGTPISTNSTEYYDNGWVKSRTGPDGATTRFEYWEDGQTFTVTDALNNKTTYFYDDAGRQESVVDALQRITRFKYDALGRQTRVTFDDGTYTTNEFNELGQRVGMKDQAGLHTQYGYSVSGLLTNVLKPQVPNPTNAYALESPEWKYQYDDQGRLLVVTDPTGHSTTNTFDEFGREARRSLPMGQIASNQFNAIGQLWKQYDFKGQRVEYRYDNFGRVTNKFYFVAGGSSPSNSVTYYYNPLGQLTNVTERSGTDAGTGYAAVGNGNGDTLQARGPLPWVQGVVASVLRGVPMDVWGGLTALALCGLALACVPRQKRRELALCVVEVWRTQSFSLSALGGEGRGEVVRLRRLRLPSFFWRLATVITLAALIGSDPSFDRLWNAQAACGDTASNSSTDTIRITTFSYDFEGRLTQVNSPEGYINYEYDLATGRHTKTCTAKSEVAYGYDQLGRLKTVTVLKRNGSPVNETTTYTYTAVGSRETVRLPNGVVTTWQYDNLNRLTNLVNRAGDGTLLSQFSYQLHSTGRRTGAVEIIRQEDVVTIYQTNTLNWAYDGLYRLTNEVSVSTAVGGSYTNSYQYDLNGNRWQKQSVSVSGISTVTNLYNANDQLLREVTLVSGAPTATNNYVYDDNGSLIARTNISSSSSTVLYGYDLKNKLSSATTVGSGITENYQYNDQGIRVRTINSGSVKYFLVDANNHTGYAQVLEELNTVGGTPTRSYVIGDDVLAQCGTTANDPRWLLYDGHGSTRQLSDANWEVTSRYNYDAYGVTQSTSTASPETSLLYCGEQYDETLEMYNLRARYYNPATGTFNQRDTFAGNNFDPQSLHKYAYANCDPINGLDPSGEFTLTEILVTSAIVGIVSGIVAGIITKNWKTGLYVGLTAALITAAIMVAITFMPAIIQFARAWLSNAGRAFSQGYHPANRTVTNQLWKKIVQEFGPNPTDAQKLLYLSNFSKLRLILEGAGGIIQKLLYGWFTHPVVFWQWLGPLGQAGLVLAAPVAAVLVWIYRDNLQELYNLWIKRDE